LVVVEGDGDINFSIRNCSYIAVEGFKIKGILDRIPVLLAWRYWGTYRYLVSGNWVYGDRKEDICATYSLPSCTDIPPMVLAIGTTYVGLPNIQALNVSRPALFDGKGLLVQLSHHIRIQGNEIYNFPGGGLRVTASDFVDVLQNDVHHNSGRASVGTHGLVIEGLTAESGDNSAVRKLTIARNTVHDNYNELYSWVQTKTICTVGIDEGKGIALLRTSPTQSNFNGMIRVENNICYNNGKSGIHTNDVDNAEIINNTVYANGYTNINNAALSAGTNAGISIQSSNNIAIINNIAVVANGISPALIALSEGQNCSNWQVSNNLVLGGGPSDFVGGYTVADPLFVNVGGGDVHLLAASTAINTGLASGAPSNDFDGQPRDANPDIGALEYAAPVGIVWLQFEAQVMPAQTVQLDWATTAEVNADAYVVQRSADGLQWTTIQNIKALGNIAGDNHYATTDLHPLSGISHYRLQQMDLDGQISYSAMRTVAILSRGNASLQVWPNPAQDRVTIASAAGESIQVYTMEGRNITAQIPKQAQGENRWMLDISQLTAGAYFCKSGTQVGRIWKQ
jgi:Secretion system C-terminal sorting domain